MEVFTFSKKGDGGETSLLTGERVSKASLRPETYGTLDEASSVLGLAKAFCSNDTVRRMVHSIQEDLLLLGAQLACNAQKRFQWKVEGHHVQRLEQWIEELQREVPLPRHFVLPGTNPVSASLDVARTVVRRAERRAAGLKEGGMLEDPWVLAYLNRLADLLFTLARYAEKYP
ncbi:MAG: cob(I)yrinic acid a,c-diamide adenosyltransferase [Desulfosoma sp.]|uniref:cob(I)yrinic acid a,c-diamide adenosyltransferase n=1 Tax=Desulfosoma sp. TaxID=2603217 RepID=UPI0040495C91